MTGMIEAAKWYDFKWSVPAHNEFGLIGGFPDILIVLIMLGIALALIFAGRSVFKVLASVVVGLVGASLGIALGALSLGPLGALLGAVLGFVAGALLGLFLLAVGVGVAFGYLGYNFALYVSGSGIMAIVVGAILFVVGVAIYGKALTIVSALLGALLLLHVMLSLGFGVEVGAFIAAVAGVAGIIIQSKDGRKYKQNSRGGGQNHLMTMEARR